MVFMTRSDYRQEIETLKQRQLKLVLSVLDGRELLLRYLQGRATNAKLALWLIDTQYAQKYAHELVRSE